MALRPCECSKLCSRWNPLDQIACEPRGYGFGHTSWNHTLERPQDSLQGPSQTGWHGGGLHMTIKPSVWTLESVQQGYRDVGKLVHERGAQGPPGVPTLYVHLRDINLAVRNR